MRLLERNLIIARDCINPLLFRHQVRHQSLHRGGGNRGGFANIRERQDRLAELERFKDRAELAQHKQWVLVFRGRIGLRHEFDARPSDRARPISLLRVAVRTFTSAVAPEGSLGWSF